MGREKRLNRLFLISVLLLALCAVVSSGEARASSWTVFTYDGGNPVAPGMPSDITFAFDNTHLSLNSSRIVTVGGSSSMSWTLLFSGNWGVCGTIDELGNYTPDPYASFKADGQGGSIEWSADTPSGYATQLILGGSFTGDGASTYVSQWGMPIREVPATLALNTHPSIWGAEYNLYEPESHAFLAEYRPVATAIPEPTGMLTLLSGAISIAGFGFRARRSRRISA
jgi:hypothetical protein